MLLFHISGIDFFIHSVNIVFMPQKEIYIKVTENGPYLVYGISKVETFISITDEESVALDYATGKSFEVSTTPVSLCRCGKSETSPFCDGTHSIIGFDGLETAGFEAIISGCKRYEGLNLTLLDNEKYCSYARFCDANGSIWNLIRSYDGALDAEIIRQARLCPSGRLIVFDKEGNVLEENIEKSIVLLEEPESVKIDGPIWVRGGIRIESVEGRSYEVRNRQTLCRCGESENKPFCDSTHWHIKFKIKTNN